MQNSTTEKWITKSLIKQINPVLKNKGLVFEKGFSVGNYEFDLLVKSSMGYTHIFQIKKQLPIGSLRHQRQLHAYSVLDGENKPVKFILACYNEGDWRFFDDNGQEKSIEELFSEYKEGTNACLPSNGIFYAISIILFVICLTDFLINCVAISSEVAFLLCAAGVFAILPSILPRVKEINLGPFTLVLVSENTETNHEDSKIQ